MIKLSVLLIFFFILNFNFLLVASEGGSSDFHDKYYVDGNSIYENNSDISLYKGYRKEDELGCVFKIFFYSMNNPIEDEDLETRKCLEGEREKVLALIEEGCPHVAEIYPDSLSNIIDNKFITINISPLYENFDLRKYLNANRENVTVDLYVRWTKSLIECLLYLEREEYLHGDLKGENIFVDNRLRIYVGDWEFSNSVKKYREVGVCGTRPYMAPEILTKDNQKNWNTKIDVWSFGVILCEFINGSYPFPNDKILWPNSNKKEGNSSHPHDKKRVNNLIFLVGLW